MFLQLLLLLLVLVVAARAVAAGVPVARVGTTGGVSLTGPHLGAISVEDLTAAHEAFLPALMSGETA